MSEDVWASHDLPVLRAAVEDLDKDAFEVTAEHLAVKHLDGLSVDEVRLSLKRLCLGGYLQEPPRSTRRGGWDKGESVVAYSAEALRAVGRWPSTEVALERLIKALEDAAAKTDDPEAQSALRKTARWLGSTATNVGAGVAAAVITGGMA